MEYVAEGILYIHAVAKDIPCGERQGYIQHI